MYCPLIYRQRGLVHDFGEGRVRVDDACDIFTACREFHCHYSLGNQLGDVGDRGLRGERGVIAAEKASSIGCIA